MCKITYLYKYFFCNLYKLQHYQAWCSYRFFSRKRDQSGDRSKKAKTPEPMNMMDRQGMGMRGQTLGMRAPPQIRVSTVSVDIQLELYMLTKVLSK